MRMREQSPFATQPADSKAISVAVLVTATVVFGHAIFEMGTRPAMAFTGSLLALSLTDFTASRALRTTLKLLTLALVGVAVAAS
jgi:hypothetical protein